MSAFEGKADIGWRCRDGRALGQRQAAGATATKVAQGDGFLTF